MKGLVELYKETEVNENDVMFTYISNYNKFQAAKAQGLFRPTIENYIKFLKYENTHARRELVLHRVFNLLITEYKRVVAKELIDA